MLPYLQLLLQVSSLQHVPTIGLQLMQLVLQRRLLSPHILQLFLQLWAAHIRDCVMIVVNPLPSCTCWVTLVVLPVQGTAHALVDGYGCGWPCL